jgi:MFS transporter, PAT family, solute carrier family 33 (acetyl-CoA transportor), member 1
MHEANQNHGPTSSGNNVYYSKTTPSTSSPSSAVAIDTNAPLLPPPPLYHPASSSFSDVKNINIHNNINSKDTSASDDSQHDDRLNYALLIVLYTLQGIPMGLSASIPFLIQQKVQAIAAATASAAAATAAAAGAAGVATAVAGTTSTTAASAARLSYNANAIFAMCSWPFSLKLLWAPIVDACFIRPLGRRKSWLIPVQALAGLLMVFGSSFVEQQLGLTDLSASAATSAVGGAAAQFNVKGVTAFFFVLYFLMATQDIVVDGWALTMLSKKNRGRGPVCNSIGQNIGYFLSFVGFLALNDVESSERIWRPLLRLPSNPKQGLVSLGSFIRVMGYFMLVTTTAVALLKHETNPIPTISTSTSLATTTDPLLLSPASGAFLSIDHIMKRKKDDDADIDDHELDASEIGLKETYHRLWAVCKLPAVRWLFVILLTYRLPTALSDNVKFLKAVELGLSKSTTALLSPTVILPLGILVPIVATKIWHGHPLRQFMTAFELRVSIVPILDVLMLWVLKNGYHSETSSSLQTLIFWIIVVASTAMQTIVSSLQFNAQMTFFASRVDPAIGGSYMTLLNTCANLGGSWPPVLVMWLVGKLTRDPACRSIVDVNGIEQQVCDSVATGRDPYFSLQIVFSILGFLWIFLLGNRVRHVAQLPDDAWRTHLLDNTTATVSFDEESSQSRDQNRTGFAIFNGNNNYNNTSTMTNSSGIEMGFASDPPQQSSLWGPNKQNNKRE